MVLSKICFELSPHLRRLNEHKERRRQVSITPAAIGSFTHSSVALPMNIYACVWPSPNILNDKQPVVLYQVLIKETLALPWRHLNARSQAEPFPFLNYGKESGHRKAEDALLKLWTAPGAGQPQKVIFMPILLFV